MLPARHRMRRSDDFTDAVRRGTRSGARRLVVHLRSVRTDQGPTGARGEDAALVGFVVPKSVGNAVRRNEVKRRLRALMAERLDALVPGARVVVRALPPAARSTSADLAQDLDRALAGARRREHRRAEPGRVA